MAGRDAPATLMRLSHQHKFIFFANPKTGSKSMRGLLNPYNEIADRRFLQTTEEEPFYTHMRPIEVREIFAKRGWPFGEYYRFVFVRNPWTRLASVYDMICRADREFNLSFAAWLQSIKTSGEGGGGPEWQRWRRYGTYSIESFAGDDSGQLLVDDIFRLEDIQLVPDRLRARGIPIPPGETVPWLNRAETEQDLLRHYTPELVALVRERYAKEIAQFGYEFGRP